MRRTEAEDRRKTVLEPCKQHSIVSQALKLRPEHANAHLQMEVETHLRRLSTEKVRKQS